MAGEGLFVFAGLLREHEEAFAGHRSVRSGLKPVMNAQQCVDSQLIVEAPALMSMVHPYSISLTNHRKVTIRSLTSRSVTGRRWRNGQTRGREVHLTHP